MLNSFTSYISYFEAGEDMTDEEYGQYMRAIHNFAYKDIEPDYSKLSPLVKAALRTVIASVRKNKEDRMNGTKGGRPSKTEKAGLSENEKGGYFFTETNVNDNVNVNEKENVKGEGEPFPAPESPSPSSGFADLQTTVYKKIQEHNKNSLVESKIPVSTSLLSFVQKEFRELLDVMKGSPPEEILHTVDNLLKSAKEQRKRKYSWWFFLKDINEYRPEYFQEKTGRPADISSDDFFNLMKDKPGFNMVLFCTHEQDWIKAGKPFDNAYFELQRTWEGDSVT